ncbi:TPA: hypothetical protein ACJJYD_004784, partial [Enterobacter hormaechei subsp. xiangfangensis]
IDNGDVLFSLWREIIEFWRRSQESHLVINHVEFIDYFTMRFTDMPPIMPPHVFLNDQLADL